MKIYKCDRCGKDIENYECYKEVKVCDSVPDSVPESVLIDIYYKETYLKVLDLCEDCFRELTNKVKSTVEDFIKGEII